MGATIRHIVIVAAWVAAFESRYALAADPPTSKAKPRSEQAALALEIRERVEELQALRRNARQAEEQHRGEIAVLQRQTETLHRQLPPVESIVRDQRRELTQLKEAIARDTQTSDRAHQWISVAAEFAAPFAERAAKRATRSIQDDSARRATEYNEAATWLKTIEPPQQVKGLQQLVRLVGEEWQTSRSTSVTNQRIEWDAGKKSQHAWIFRLGSVSRVFITEDGKTVGFGSGNSKDLWRLDLSESAQDQIRDVFAIARDQRPPTIAPFPVLRRPTSPVPTE